MENIERLQEVVKANRMNLSAIEGRIVHKIKSGESSSEDRWMASVTRTRLEDYVVELYEAIRESV
jgi:hypothetical protein